MNLRILIEAEEEIEEARNYLYSLHGAFPSPLSPRSIFMVFSCCGEAIARNKGSSVSTMC